MINQAKGFRGRRKNTFNVAKLAVEKSMQYAYRDRKVRKREFRSLWLQRINAGARELGVSYSVFINGLKKLNVGIDRKMLAELAMHEPSSFKHLVDKVKTASK